MKKSILLLIAVFSAISVFSQIDKDSSKFKFGGHLGISVSNLTKPDSLTDGAELLYAGFNSQYKINERFGVSGLLTLGSRGANSENMQYKLRSSYLDVDLSPEVYFLKYFTFRYGLRFACHINSTIKELSADTQSGYSRKDYKGGMENELQMISGLEFALSDNLSVVGNYTLPVTKMDYSYWQIGFVFRPEKDFYEISEPTVRSIPEDENKKKFVTDLKLNNDGLKTIPIEVYQLEKLEKLSLIRNDLKVIPDDIGRLKSLKYLALEYNQLVSISDSIGSLENLEYLNLRYNNLTELPEEIGNLKNLKFLYLGHNQLKELPSSIGELENLQYLQIGKNFLNELPEEVFELTNLIELDLRDSGIMSIPDKLHKLRNLERLYIDCPVPPSVVGANPRLKINSGVAPMGGF